MPARLLQPSLNHRPAAPIRLMIVDDSIVARTVLSRILEARQEFEIAAVASDADQALGLLRTERVDVVLLDVEMPGMDGLTALPEILARSKGARVLIVSSAAAEGAAATVRALTLGAADTLLKPGAGNFAGRFAEVLIERLLRIGGAGRLDSREPRVAGPAASSQPGRIDCLALGASTGGLHALSSFFDALPAAFSAPMLVTQHLPAVFIPYFADQLCDMAGRSASVAADGDRLVSNRILVAPGDGHIRLVRQGAEVRVRIDRTPMASGCMPSVDPMLESLAETFGATGLAVVLSGMGRDGVIGARALVEAGGEVVVQDAASSVVWGMPGAIANAGLAAAVMPPARIARRVALRDFVAST